MLNESQMSGLMPPQKQVQHNQKIRTKILKFLSEEKYSTPTVLQELTRYKSRQGVAGVMEKLAQNGLVKKHKINALGGLNFVVWGITAKGIYAVSESDQEKNVRGFDPSKMSLLTLNHKSKIQLLKIKLLDQTYITPPIDPDIWKLKIPDLISSEHEDGELLAWEVELTIKSQRRYQEIADLYGSLKWRNRLKRVYWLTESENDAARLHSIFRKIEFEDGEASPMELHRFMPFDTAIEKLT